MTTYANVISEQKNKQAKNWQVYYKKHKTRKILKKR